MKTIITELMLIEKDLTNLYKRKDELLKEFPREIPEGFAAFQNEDGTWTRMTVSDNAAKIDEGYWKTVRVERYSLKVEILKNMPKELKEVTA